jgi:hypothetical protein
MSADNWEACPRCKECYGVYGLHDRDCPVLIAERERAEGWLKILRIES